MGASLERSTGGKKQIFVMISGVGIGVCCVALDEPTHLVRSTSASEKEESNPLLPRVSLGSSHCTVM